MQEIKSNVKLKKFGIDHCFIFLIKTQAFNINKLVYKFKVDLISGKIFFLTKIKPLNVENLFNLLIKLVKRRHTKYKYYLQQFAVQLKSSAKQINFILRLRLFFTTIGYQKNHKLIKTDTQLDQRSSCVVQIHRYWTKSISTFLALTAMMRSLVTIMCNVFNALSSNINLDRLAKIIGLYRSPIDNYLHYFVSIVMLQCYMSVFFV